MKRLIVAAVFVLSIMGGASVVSASAGSGDATTTSTSTSTTIVPPTTETTIVEVAPVPVKSGSGRRIVYANRQQRVWV